ncbi:BrnA antitoxin family protein [Roseibium sp. AS2]|uniref:BrnA antitoxin family protein n=1 Tax=Roseibium sp. AS2 TaxID=3135781 RepID=UPI00316BF102
MARPPRRHTTAIEQAEALFKSATTKPVEETPRPVRTAMPVGKETVSVRLDRDVLEHFQDDGPGWQDRINAALRKAAGLS